MGMMYSWLLYLLLDECIDSMEEEMENRFSVVDLEYRVGRESPTLGNVILRCDDWIL